MYFSIAKHGMLAPADPDARQFADKHAVGTVVELSKPSGSAFRRFVFTMLRKCEPFTPLDHNGQRCNLRAYLAISTGFVGLVRRNGVPVIVPESLGEMPADRFEAFWVEARLFLLRRLLPPPGQDAAADAVRAEIEVHQEGEGTQGGTQGGIHA